MVNERGVSRHILRCLLEGLVIIYAAGVIVVVDSASDLSPPCDRPWENVFVFAAVCASY